MPYRFIPNSFATRMFNLVAPGYTDQGMTNVLEQALGKENYDRYMIAQDPLCGGRSEGIVKIILNPDETHPGNMRFEAIGTILKIDEKPLRLRLK
jgi:hypothetical protein